MKLIATLALAALTTLAAATDPQLVGPGGKFLPKENRKCTTPNFQGCDLDDALLRCKDGKPTVYTCSPKCIINCKPNQKCDPPTCRNEKLLY